MNYYIFGSKSATIKQRKHQALLHTTDLDNAMINMQKFIKEVYDNNLYLIMDLSPTMKKTKKMITGNNGNEKFQYLIIAEWHIGDSFDVMKCIRSDYITMSTSAKKIEMNSNRRVAELIEYHVTNRVYAVFDIKFVKKQILKRKCTSYSTHDRMLFDVSDYLALEKTPEHDPFLYDVNNKYIIDLSGIGVADFPKKFQTFNLKYNKFDQEITEQDRKDMEDSENSETEEPDMEIKDKKIPKIAMF